MSQCSIYETQVVDGQTVALVGSGVEETNTYHIKLLLQHQYSLSLALNRKH